MRGSIRLLQRLFMEKNFSISRLFQLIVQANLNLDSM